MPQSDFPEEQSLEQLFQQADELGKKQYHRLTPEDFEDYRKYDYWRNINGDGECGSTQESRDWVRQNSGYSCPVCQERFSTPGHHRTIDHKLPRAQYPWLSLNFANLWVICLACNQEKAEMHWFEYEHYMLLNHPEIYSNVHEVRPNRLIKNLRQT